MMYAAEQLRQPNPEWHPGHDPSKKPDRQKSKGLSQTRKTSFIPETCVLLFCVLAFLVLNLFLLSRFAEITSMKHQVSQMEKRFEQLQNQREQLLVEIERSSKLEWVEQEATTRLGMRYPDKSQVIYISVDPGKVELVENQINRNSLKEPANNGLLPQSIERIFHKFAGVLRI